jgi:hypothetical protein
MYTHVFLYVHRCVCMMYRSYTIYTRTARVSPVDSARRQLKIPSKLGYGARGVGRERRDRPEVRTMDPDVMWEKQCHLHHPPVISIFIGGMFTIPRWVVYNIV